MNQRQQKFINEYLIDLNATRAAVEAGYSPKTATAQGARLLTNASVKAEIEKRQRDDAENLKIKREDIIAELAQIGFTSLLDLIDIDALKNGLIKLKESTTDDNLKIISEVKPTKFGPILKTHDKLKALELLARYLGFEKEPININVSNNFFEALLNAGQAIDLNEIPELKDQL